MGWWAAIILKPACHFVTETVGALDGLLFCNLVDQKALKVIWGKYSSEVGSILMKVYPANELDRKLLFSLKPKQNTICNYFVTITTEKRIFSI